MAAVLPLVADDAHDSETNSRSRAPSSSVYVQRKFARAAAHARIEVEQVFSLRRVYQVFPNTGCIVAPVDPLLHPEIIVFDDGLARAHGQNATDDSPF